MGYIPGLVGGGGGGMAAGGGGLAASIGGAAATGGLSIAGMAAMEGIKAIKNRNNDVKEERANLLNQQNDFQKFLAQQQATNPTHALKGYQDSLLSAGKLRLGKGTGVSFDNERGDPRVTGSLAQDPALEQLAASFTDKATNNLGVNEAGILEYIAPQLELAVSDKMKKKGEKYGNYNIGGEQRGFGTKDGEAYGKEQGGGFMDFLKKTGVNLVGSDGEERIREIMESLGKGK